MTETTSFKVPEYRTYLERTHERILKTLANIQRTMERTRELEAEWERDRKNIEESRMLLDGMKRKYL